MLQGTSRTNSTCRAWWRASRSVLSLTLVLLATIAAAHPAQAQTYAVLHSFKGKDGSTPSASLSLGNKGDLYGTTAVGGDVEAGVVFRLTKAGKEIVLHHFGAGDGIEPLAGVIQDAKGNLYGTTFDGGTSGFGTVFGLNKA